MGLEVKFVPVENPEENRPLGIPRRTWEGNIKMNLKGIGREIDSSGSGYGQVPRSFEQSNLLSGSIEYSEFHYQLRNYQL
jgi:hypothetical protein